MSESGKIPVHRDRLMMDVRTGLMDSRHVFRRLAGMRSRGLDLMGEFLTSLMTCLSVREVNWLKLAGEAGSGIISKVSRGSSISTSESCILDTLSMKNSENLFESS